MRGKRDVLLAARSFACDHEATAIVAPDVWPSLWTALSIRFQTEHGIQYWPIFLLSSGEHVGCCGLRPHHPANRVYELGVHICLSWWRQHLAEEAACAVIDYGFGTLRGQRYIRWAQPKQQSIPITAAQARLPLHASRVLSSHWFAASFIYPDEMKGGSTGGVPLIGFKTVFVYAPLQIQNREKSMPSTPGALIQITSRRLDFRIGVQAAQKVCLECPSRDEAREND